MSTATQKMMKEPAPALNAAAPPGADGLYLEEALLSEVSRPGRVGYSLAASDVPAQDPARVFPSSVLRKIPAALPEVSEADLVRHFTRLSTWNFNKDAGFIPLGSCTMKHNPRINERVAALPGFAAAHPYQGEAQAQGALQLTFELEQMLATISGMDAVSTRPAAGSHGELVGLMIIRAYLRAQGNVRRKIIIPDSAHGTNPASAAICGYEVIGVKTGPNGVLEPEAVAAVMDESVAALMITNPNTLGLFEQHIVEIAKIVHRKGGLVYCDGANLNAIMGIVDLGHCGIDVMHFNLHKTFTTPHGGGGPGSGPVGVKTYLAPYLPIPRVVQTPSGWIWSEDFPQSIGRVKAFYGNFGMLVRAYTYIREMGAAGLRRVSELSVLNASYLRSQLVSNYHLPYATPSLHEFVVSDKRQLAHGVKTKDIAKRLLDYGFHPPTIYFPLLVPGAMMIEPTETENLHTCNEFIAAMQAIARECETTPERVQHAPHRTFRTRLDDVRASRQPVVTWRQLQEQEEKMP